MTTSFGADVLQPLVRGTDLERTAARDALADVLAGLVDPILISSFLTALTAKGETVDEMTGFVDAMLAAATTVPNVVDAIDIVGTGGDQLHTVNVSTMASFVVAACGVPVAKHGNRAASSSVGSADVLEALGVQLDVTPDVAAHCLKEANMAFFFAPKYHHALAAMGPIRRQLGFRTIFNVLGPLANPALVRRGLIGVAQAHLLDPMAQVLHARGVDHMILVRGNEGLDELSLANASQLAIVTPDGVTLQEIDAGDELDLHHDVDAIRGGGTEENVSVVRRFLSGAPGPVSDVVCANAALALMAAGRAATLREGFDAAHRAVREGAAANVLERLVSASHAATP